MSADMWLYNPDVCDGDYCPMNCSHCYKADKIIEQQEMEDEDERD